MESRKLLPAAAEFFDGRIDVLVNNAGFNGHYSLIKDMPLAHWRETIDINLTGTMLVTRSVLPFMLDRKAGAIVTTASNVARRGLPYRADYVCSKWAILGFTQTLALEVASHNIRVNAVCPGPIEGDRIEDVMAHHAKFEGKIGRRRAPRVGGDADEPVRRAAGSRGGDGLSLQLGGERNDRPSDQRHRRIHHDVSFRVRPPAFDPQKRRSKNIRFRLLDEPAECPMTIHAWTLFY